MEYRGAMRRAGQISLALAGAFLFFWLLLPVFLPFFLAFIPASMAQPLVRPLSERCGLPRAVSSSIVLVFLLGSFGFLLYGLARTLWGELSAFTQELPALLQSFAPAFARLREILLHWADAAPPAIYDAMHSAIDGFFESGSTLAASAYARLFALVTDTLSALPRLFLLLATTLVATFLLGAQYDNILQHMTNALPKAWAERSGHLLQCGRKALSAWLLAQVKLSSITFGLMTLGLTILGVGYPLLFGGLIALVDALPLFGSGTMLIPWALFSLLQGNTGLAVGLAVLYGLGYFTRAMLEPRLLGKQVGLHPLVTLAALYGGFRLFGVLGMLVCPLGAVVLKQFLRARKEG